MGANCQRGDRETTITDRNIAFAKKWDRPIRLFNDYGCYYSILANKLNRMQLVAMTVYP